MGPFDEGQTRIHDVNPGDLNAPNLPDHFPDGGVFWTRVIKHKSVWFSDGQSVMDVDRAKMKDFFNGPNAILRNGLPPIKARASVDVRWHKNGETAVVDNPSQGFSGSYYNADAELSFSFSTKEFHFDTQNSSEVNITHAYTCHVQSGAFYS